MLIEHTEVLILASTYLPLCASPVMSAAPGDEGDACAGHACWTQGAHHVDMIPAKLVIIGHQ
jgi:hypothetical protein